MPAGSRTATRSAARHRRRPAPTAGRATCRGRGADGRRFSTSSPRDGRLAPRSDNANTSSRKVSSACVPGSGLPPSVGNHDKRRDVLHERLADPDAEAGQAGDPERVEPGEQGGGERRHDEQHERASSWPGRAVRRRCPSRRRRPMPAPYWPSRAGSATARRACRTPRSRKPPVWPGRTASSGTGRRARPPSARPRQPSRTGSRESACRTPSTKSLGKMLGIDFDAEPNQSSTVAWRISRIPSEATSLASGDDVRSGRNTSSSLSTPTRIATSIVTIAAGNGAERDVEVARLEGPEAVRGDHRDRAGGEVDDPGAAVRDDHGHRDSADHRARPEPEQDEENDVLHGLLGARGGRAVIGRGSKGYGTHPSGGGTKPLASSQPASPLNL